ncbi:MAG TPA: hypothetical protein VMW52_10765 [Phycisphaerae bacterium]|nr:hypothetical protein [Phycisphaerae bacterium]
MIGLFFTAAGLLWVLGCIGWALTANAEFTEYTGDLRAVPCGEGVHIFKSGYVGIDPAGYAKPFVPGDVFVGIADREADNAAGTAGDVSCIVRMQGDFVLSLTSAAAADVGKAVYATADNALSLSGHPDGFVGRIIGLAAANTVYVRLRPFGQQPGDADGCKTIYISGAEFFLPTGGGASATVLHPKGMIAETALGVGVLHYPGEGGGVQLAMDAVAEVALASLYSEDSFPVDQGITMEADVVMADKGDDVALDFDFGLGTPLTANSKADIDHAEMVDLIAFHMDGNSDNICAQSDNNTTDVAPVDTTIDNDSTTDVSKHWKIVGRPTGVCELWIDGVRALDSTVFAVRSTVALAAFVNIEKTNNDTPASVIIRNLRIAGGRP